MPNRPDDEELTLYFYGEHPAPDELERALAADPERARRYERLRRELEALGAIEPPEPRAGLEGRLWHRLAPELAAAPARRARIGSGWARFALAAAAALALVAGGFLAGRVTRTPPAAEVAAAAPAPLAAEARERLLEASLVAHLEGSERLLVELANDPGDTDFAADERRFAETLLASNRLYRRAAERAGQRRVAALLAELEPLLIELSHPNGTGGAVATAKQHLESRDLLFKVRVTRSRI
jgi:hypothetical protein